MNVTRIHPERPTAPKPGRCNRRHVDRDPRTDGHLHIVTKDGWTHCSFETAGMTGICEGDNDPNAEMIRL